MLDTANPVEVVAMTAGELAQAETVIESGLRTFVEVGNALLSIRDGRGYRLQGYRAFEEYCRERWGFSRSRAHRLIEAAEVAENLLPIGNTLPATESQARPLSRLEPEQQREAWALAVETAPDGKVTAAHVERVVDQLTGEIVVPARVPFVSHNSGENEWYTPAEYVESARRVLGTIEIDPASSVLANETVRAETFFTKDNSGLIRPWHGRVWMNPPYSGDLIGKFTGKLVEHFEAGDVTEAIVLVNNATETGWFQGMLRVAAAVCFVRSRIKFIDVEGNPSGAPLQGQAVLYLGTRADVFAEHFSQYGVVLHSG